MFAATLMVVALPIMLWAGEGHKHGQEEMKCPMSKKQCAVKDICLAKEAAGPFSVILCKSEKNGESNLCILDSAGKEVAVENLKVQIDGEDVETEKEKCGYELESKTDGKTIDVRFSVAKTAYSVTLKPAIAEKTSKPVNTICPVMGEKVNPKYTTVYKGKTIGFCCAACPAEFEKDPEKYMKKLK